MNQVSLVHSTADAESLIAYCARVSSEDQSKPPGKLIKYLIKHEHWSPFEMASMCLEIQTTRSISAQILRHRSFSFQEFSTRYSKSPGVFVPQLRAAGSTNRQSSLEPINDSTLNNNLINYLSSSYAFYDSLIEAGVANECAREVLPLCTITKLYMHGTLRSWIHYIQLRTQEDTQLEHREIAEMAKEIFKQQFPLIHDAVFI